MSISSAILKLAVPVPKIEQFNRFLFIGPHPDDIEIGAGATAAKLAAEGKEVLFLICTDGRYGDINAPTNISREELIEIRRSESINSAAELGVDKVIFLNFCDGGFYDEKELLCAMAKVVGDFKPDIIFAPDPWVSSECHADHLKVGTVAAKLVCFAPYPGIMENYGATAANVQAIAFYMTAKPNRFVKTGHYIKKQLDALFSNHLSQFPAGSKDAKSIELYLKIRSFDFGLRSLKGRAEGFRVLGQVHMHCMPEAGK